MSRKPLVAAIAAALVVTSSALALNGEPKKLFTKADQARATSILLRDADVGRGWVPAASSESPGADPRCPGWRPDESDLVETGEATRNFKLLTGEVITSYAALYRSAAQARASWDRGVKPEMLKCLSGMLETLTSPGLSVRTVQSGTVAFPHVAPRTAAFCLVLEMASGPTAIRVYIDMVFLTDDRAQGALMLMAVRHPFGAAFEHRLAGLMAKRIAHAL
jgi:hypothetical protein